jgi:hypothetical protein
MRNTRLNDIRRKENELNAIIIHGNETVSEPKIVKRWRCSQLKDLFLSIDGAETSKSKAGFAAHFNYEKCILNPKF